MLKTVQVAVAGGIEQAQTREMAGAAELLRGRCQQDQVRRGARELIDQCIVAAGGVGTPRQVVRFVDDSQIPAGGERLFGAPRRVAQECKVDDDQFFIQK